MNATNSKIRHGGTIVGTCSDSSCLSSVGNLAMGVKKSSRLLSSSSFESRTSMLQNVHDYLSLARDEILDANEFDLKASESI